uniref:ABC transporter permease n=1 Tax=Fervidicoccus fontis TaxID=683846 RepID=A0A7C1E097_9CREN
MSLGKFIAKRAFQAFVTLIGALLVVFLIMRILPGDPARLIAGPEASWEDVENIRKMLGLDKPLYIQFIEYVKSVFKGDFGKSIKYGTPVIDEILARLPYTILLAVAAEAIAVALALPLGVYSALKPNSTLSRFISAISLFGASLPIFWLALIFIYIFSAKLKWLPSFGAGSWKHLILPSFTLALLLMGNLTRITRSSVMEAASMNHVTTAVAKGLDNGKVLRRHVLRVSMIPIITIMGLQIGSLLGGAVITETVFAWPGIGSLLIDSIFYRDYPLAQGIILFIVLAFVIVNLAVDFVYGLIDPRVRSRTWS